MLDGAGTLWASIFGRGGIWVSTVGKNEAAVREYIQNQEKEDKRLEQTGTGGALSASCF